MTYVTCGANNNSNGELLKGICIDFNLVLLNNLKYKLKHFSNLLTFRQKENWVSQLDICIVSKGLIDNVSSLDVNQDLSLPSDHAILLIQMHFDKPKVSNEVLLKNSISLINYDHNQNISKYKPVNHIPIMKMNTT